MVTKKDKEVLVTAINRLAESSERLERTTRLLLFVTAFLLVFTFVDASAGYNYSGGAYNFFLALVVAVIIVSFILVFYKFLEK
ncbi:MAG: hypothetical protein QXL94_08780 [Candidatus Parvarchaeum sp.]